MNVVKPEVVRKYISMDEAASYLSKKPRTLYDLCKRGEVPYYQVGTTRMFTYADLDAYIERQRHEIRRRRH